MKLEHLSIVNYKNIREADLDFSSGVNCLVGKNGMGKTNLLDAIYYLSFCKSFNGVTDSQVMTHGEVFFMLNGNTNSMARRRTSAAATSFTPESRSSVRARNTSD